MSFLHKLMQRFADVFEDKPEPSATDAVPHDRFDQATWDEVRENVPAIEQMITELGTKHDYVDDFARDTFNLVVKGDPQVREAEEMAATHVPNRTMVDGFTRMPEVQQLRSLTANDPYAAAMAFVSMKSKLTEAAQSMTEAREKAAEAEAQRQAAQQAAQEAAQAMQDAADAEENLDRDDVDGAFAVGQMMQEAQAKAQAAEDAAAEAQAAREDAQASAQEAAAGSRAGMRLAAGEATKEREEENNLMSAFGVEDGDLKRMPFNERADLAKRLRNNRMARFAQLIGQFKQMSAAQSRRRVLHAADEIVGVTLGDDLQRLTMGELVNMATPELEDDFWLRYVNRELVVYDLAGTEKMGQGPIVVVCDESGSMEAALQHGTREAWSKAFALALLDQARRQGRDFHYIGFSSAHQQWHTAFPKGRGPVTQVIEMCEHFFDGGTSYERPLTMALDIVEQDYALKNEPKPDIVFITDEEHGQLNEQFMARWRAVKQRQSLRCFGIAMVQKVNGALSAVADDVRMITSMTSDPHQVADMFRMI